MEAVLRTNYALEALHADPNLRASLQDSHVRIFSREHGAYWRPNGNGYTQNRDEAGKFPFDSAWERSRHAGPEKGIEYEVVTQPNSSLLDELSILVAKDQKRPTWDEYFLSSALLISSRSPCDRLHVGCVLVSTGDQPNRILATGYNGFIAGSPHVSRVRDNHEQATVHAEQNAVADSARRGTLVGGCKAYITHFPCVNCAKILAAAGVKEVVYLNDYHNDPISEAILKDANVALRKYEKTENA